MRVTNFPISQLYLQGIFALGFFSVPALSYSQKNDSLRTKSIDEVVVVGYGKQSKMKTSGSVAETNLKGLESRSVGSVADALQGKTAGVTVISEGGDPTGKPKVSIRGLGGYNGENPLYVVDGVIFESTPSINPSDIESMSVVKDATAAIYGARAAGGVIFITTKKGNKKALSLEIDAKQGFQNAWKLRKSLNAAEYQDVMTAAFTNAGKPVPDAFNPTKFPDGRITRTDWVDEIFRTGSLQEYNVNLSGGSDLSKFFMSFNHRNHDGILLNTNSRRYNFRLNSEHKIKDWLIIGENMYYNFSNGNTANTNDGYTGAILSAMYYAPNVPVYDANGNYSGLPIAVAGSYGDMINPVAYLNRVRYQIPRHELLLNPYIEIKPFKGFSYKSNFALTYGFTDIKDVQVRRLEVGKILDKNSVEYLTNKYKSLLAEQILNYKSTFGKHGLEATGVLSFQENTEDGFKAKIENFSKEDEFFMYLQNGAENKSMSSYLTKTALYSLTGRLNYDYDGKYNISLLGRRDGSSLLPKVNRYENYYAVSGSWVVSRENFLRGNETLSFMKLRASHGLSGNLGGINSNSVYPLLNRFENVIFGQIPSQNAAYYTNILGNPDLKWGSSRQTTFGVDLGFFDNRLNFTADYFMKTSLNQIIDRPLPSTSGYNVKYINGGEFRDKGFEFGINFGSKKGSDFTYNINANVSTLKNEIISLAGVNAINLPDHVRQSLRPLALKVGESLYSYYGYQVGGIFQSQEEVDNYKDANGKLIQPKAKPGDFKFLKAEGSTGELDPTKDYVNLGNPFPKFSYGFSVDLTYKNFDLNMFFQGVHGNKIFNGLKFVTMNPAGAGQNYNMDKEVLNSWTTTNTNTNMPRLIATDPSGNFSKVSSFYVEDGSFLRLKNLTLGYTLPKELINSIGLTKVRIYATSNNLLTFTKYTGFDPEVGLDYKGIDQGRYPQARTFIFGVTLSL